MTTAELPAASRRRSPLGVAGGIACALVGAVVLLGWHAGVRGLIQVSPAYRPMPYDSAVGFLLCGLAIVAVSRDRRPMVRLLAPVVFVIGSAALLGLALGRDLSLERLVGLPELFARHPRGVRVPPNAAIGFVLAAVALSLTGARSSWHPVVAVLGSIVGAVGLTSLLGYATHFEGAYSWAGLPPMAIHGAAAFVVLGLVLVRLAWTEASDARRHAPAWLPIPVGIVIGTMGVVLWQALVDEGRPWLAHATLGTAAALAMAMALTVHFGQVARRALQRVERTARELEAEALEREKVEQALGRTSAHYRSLFEHMLNGLAYCRMIYDRGKPLDFEYLDVNPAHERLTGLTNVIGRNVSEVIPGIRETNPELLDICGRVALTGRTEQFETYVDALGSWFSVAVYSPARDHFVEVFENITERKRTMEALRDSEERWRAIFHHAGVGILEVDVEGRLVAVNDRVCEILGYGREALLGMTIHELTAPGDRPRSDALNARLHAGADARFEDEKRYLRSDGTPVWVHVTVSALRDASGRFLRAIATVEDISERKRVEDDLREANHRKDEFVAELARSNAELERFAYVASHDLQEPLRTIASFTQLLARRYKDRLDATANEFIAFTLDGVSRMQTLIDDLLALSRVGTRGQPLQPTNAEETLAAALHDLRKQIDEAEATVSYDRLPTVMADPVQLGQLFRNLLSNALKFRSAEPPWIRISARAQDGQWVLSVADNGIGIAEEHFERIFVIFQRLHTRKEFPGTGMGLAICKKIVDRHGGRIWVESRPNGGATFSFTLSDAISTIAGDVRPGLTPSLQTTAERVP